MRLHSLQLALPALSLLIAIAGSAAVPALDARAIVCVRDAHDEGTLLMRTRAERAGSVGHEAPGRQVDGLMVVADRLFESVA